MIRRPFACLALAALLGLPAAAQETPRLELTLRAGVLPFAAGTAYDNAFDPNPGYARPGSFVRQTLPVDPGAGVSLQAGLTVFYTRAFGLRVSLGWDEIPLGGRPSSYDLNFLYTDWIPWRDPAYYDGVIQGTSPWPGASGRLRQGSAAVEAVVSVPAGRSVSLRFTAGTALSIRQGELQPLAYTELTYQRYGALFFHEYLVRLRLPPSVGVGISAGAEAAFRLTPAVSLVVVAAYRSGSYEGTPEVAEAFDPQSGLAPSAGALTRIRTKVVPAPLTLTPSPFRFGAGLILGL